MRVISVINVILACLQPNGLVARASDVHRYSQLNYNGVPYSYPTFNCKDKPSLSRYPDMADCSRFIYCVSGTAYFGRCSAGRRFNQVTKKCDLPPEAMCGNQSNGNGVPQIVQFPYWYQPPATNLRTTVAIASTTISTTTTTTSRPALLRPPMVQDITMTGEPQPSIVSNFTSIVPQRTFNFSLDCESRRHPCGIYPNHNGDCETFLLCQEKGPPVLKHCNDGQRFDTKSQECQPAGSATCWEEPNAGPSERQEQNRPTCQPNQMRINATDGKSVETEALLATTLLTNWGNWQAFQYCPVGSFITGVNAWRRVIQVASNTDQVGLVSVAFRCSNPNGVVSKDLVSITPGAPNDGFSSFYSCEEGGVATGFRVNVKPDVGPGQDNLATDNVELICSCGLPAQKPYDSITGLQGGHRGQWESALHCQEGEALCGVQAQLHDYREGLVGQYDNTGLNNLRMKCCKVPDPLSSCLVKEDRKLIRTCENLEGIYPRRCDFDIKVGVGYLNDVERVRVRNFYSGLGFSLNSTTVSDLKEKFSEKNSTTLYELENDDKPTIWNAQGDYEEKKLYVEPGMKLEVFQLVGTCGIFEVRANRFILQSYDKASNFSTSQYFDFDY